MRQSKLERKAEQVFQNIFDDLPKVHVHSKTAHPASDKGWDIAFNVVSGQKKFWFYVQVKSRVTPQTALSTSEQFRGLPKGAIPVLFAPTISPRVAEIVRGRGIGYADGAGNCWLSSPQDYLFIERQGLQTERQPTPAAADPFSNKSSRIVRMLLSRPLEGWQVRKLAEHPDVQVSPGLVVKVKRALVEESYAIEHDRLLYLRDPVSLLTAWAQKYSGPAEQIPLYIRGDATAAEQTISQWCKDNGIQYSLAGFSAAWRLAPEVRYNVAAAYLEDRGFDRELLNLLAAKYGGKRVDTGPNIYLWRPFDRSVFTGSVIVGKPERQVTSALQTFLDLKQSAGRGEEAAQAVFEKYLKSDFDRVAEREEKSRHEKV